MSGQVVKRLTNFVTKVNNGTEKIQSTKTAGKNIEIEWGGEIGSLTRELKNLVFFCRRFIKMDPRRMEQWTDDDFRDVKNAVDQMFTALETYTAALLQKAPLWDNSPNIGTFISGNLRDLGDATLELRSSFPWEEIKYEETWEDDEDEEDEEDEGDEQGKEDSSSDEDEEGEEDSSSDETEDRASGRSRIRAVRYHTPLKCMPLHLAVVRCLQAWTPPPPPQKEKNTWDLVKEVLSPRMVALVVTNGVSEQVAGLFGADAEAGQRMISRGEDSSKAKFWMHW